MGKYDDLLDRLQAGGDLTVEEMSGVRAARPEGNTPDRRARDHVVMLLDLRSGGRRPLGPYDDLLARAKLGYPIPKAEIAQAVTALQADPLGEHRARLLHALGLTGDAALVPLVERFLADPDPAVVSLALRFLCAVWNRTPHYIPLLLAFMRGVQPWDREQECRRRALTIAGDYLAGAAEPVFLRELLRIVTDPAEDTALRAYTYDALATALNQDAATGLPPLDGNAAPLDDLPLVRHGQDRLLREMTGTGTPAGFSAPSPPVTAAEKTADELAES